MRTKLEELIFRGDWKRVKKLLKNRDFVFSLICYPLFILFYLIATIYLANFKLDEFSGLIYTTISFGLFIFIIIINVFERIEKKFYHKRQGDKLKLKQKEVITTNK